MEGLEGDHPLQRSTYLQQGLIRLLRRRAALAKREPRHRDLPRGGGTGVQHGSAAGRDLEARRRQLLQRLAGGSRWLHERWEVGVAVAHGIPNDWWMVPVFYDGDRCVFFAWHRLRVHFGLQVYRVKGQTAG